MISFSLAFQKDKIIHCENNYFSQLDLACFSLYLYQISLDTISVFIKPLSENEASITWLKELQCTLNLFKSHSTPVLARIRVVSALVIDIKETTNSDTF